VLLLFEVGDTSVKCEQGDNSYVLKDAEYLVVAFGSWVLMNAGVILGGVVRDRLDDDVVVLREYYYWEG